ncbi:amino acid adenylation domain-containing protein [Actinoalloteichus hymeniacidonis]|uniref:Amino acid adenylation enzyme/thioester reductase family protein n=1 Tax=Actinoalloteichus hymeniacidonis TaxID=340345 RepID=A0AAC9HMA3_9PSEU|nr:amino acid adenylation domain-containing protein [Actinoalloteichus hymeniacidonis]AOS61840.1 amino acid adenylation enzyme/thioester reductase family protein [Actinoalloteichus hymeniacidonis]MBB5910140.1 amino acid adenylation domain-containing protein [Actinoalloteichus hymeniacidonis]
MSPDPDPTVPELRAVAERVRRTPEAEAVRSADEAIDYRTLWERSAQVAARVVQLGAVGGTAVGVHLERSVDLIVTLVGLLRSGCVAVPLDVGYPAERLRFMCADAGVGLVIGHQGPLDRLGGFTTVLTDRRLGYACARTALQPAPLAPFEAPEVNEDADAYLVYTSGSTGRPKGVRYTHRNLANLVSWQTEASGCGAGDRTLQFAPASFDVTYQEVLPTLGAGGTVICCDEDERLDPQLLWDLIERERINRLFVPFVMIQSLALFADEVTPQRHPLREILTSGEQVQSTATIRAMFTRLPDCRLVNQWGTTETHVATWHELPADVAGWPDLPSIGRPITDTGIRVCDPDGTPVPDGEVGELWITGAAVGPGYLNLPERTALSYRTDPLDPAVPAYRSGDLGRVLPDGLLEFLGRQDTQVKVRGFRIELGEIESALAADPSVAQAVVVVAGSAAEDRNLRAFLIPKSAPADTSTWTAGLLAQLRDRLPAYMVPVRVDVVDSLPRTPSGKVDRLALVAEEQVSAAGGGAA